ncbi:MAG: two-component system response regulator [Chloroflexi bacterium]|nr:response regulator [Chloroflexi bacterium CFX1]MCK6567588.1 response regulator [Anaerolineales bacterium]MCQ3952833.1 response regulator [Chloroflexota bacterium]MDL1920006.1 response regulator [Chloroflexi bacterium CFX5]NUQ59133.1 response regulator [Anaerolineales bacterium]
MLAEPILVMLVEDNADHAELVIRTMESHHIPTRILHISDGESALDYLLRRNDYSDPESSPRPYMILLDLRLPRVDGIEVLRMVKGESELRAIPVVILTTSEAEKDLTHAYQNYVNSYLVKPVGFEDFSNLMKDIGVYWLGWNKQTRN